MATASPPSRSPLARHFTLDPAVTFLNHGSFGACPRAVLDDQAAWRERMERQPVRFFVREYEARLDHAREALAAFVGAEADGLAFVRNATAGINAVLRSLHLEAGDELLVTDHEYPACRNVLEYVAARSGAKVTIAKIPFPGTSPQAASDAVLARANDRTRLALIDHITSQTGLILPIEKLVAELQGRGIDVLVDGAHAPGMVALDLDALGAAYYTANCHKWLCAPKGAAFLWARRDRREALHPVSISHGYRFPLTRRSRFRAEFDWTGTDDPTPWLSVPCALQTMAGLVKGGWPEVMQKNRTLVLEGRAALCQALQVETPCPDGMIGSLAAVPLPDGEDVPPTSPLYLDPLQDRLLGGHGIEVPVIPWPAPPRRVIRISAQLYNAPAEYTHLARALRAELR